MPSLPTTTRPPILFLAAVVLGIEALVVLGFGVAQVARIGSANVVVGLSAVVLMVGYAAVLILVSRGVARGRRWARGPAVATQLLQALLAYNFAAAATWWVAVALGTAAGVTLCCLLSPSATAVFVPTEPAPADGAAQDPEDEDQRSAG